MMQTHTRSIPLRGRILGQQLQRGAISDNSAYDNIHNHLIGQ